MKKTGTLTFFCGKMGAGKSTESKAISIEKNAVLISEDSWLSVHYPDQIKTFDDYLKFSSMIKPFIKSHVKNILKTGTDVVLDFPANTVNQRRWFKQLCVDIECEHELVFIDLSNDKCLLQIAKRRLEQPERAQFDNEAMFNHVTKFFEAPLDSEELNIVHVLDDV